MLLNVFALLKCRRAVAFGISLKQCINSEFLNAVSKLLMCTTTVISSTHFRMILSLWKVKSSPHLWESRVTWFCCYLWPLLLLSAELNWTVELKHWAEVKRKEISLQNDDQGTGLLCIDTGWHRQMLCLFKLTAVRLFFTFASCSFPLRYTVLLPYAKCWCCNLHEKKILENIHLAKDFDFSL